jgi:hypothetical protein
MSFQDQARLWSSFKSISSSHRFAYLRAVELRSTRKSSRFQSFIR